MVQTFNANQLVILLQTHFNSCMFITVTAALLKLDQTQNTPLERGKRVKNIQELESAEKRWRYSELHVGSSYQRVTTSLEYVFVGTDFALASPATKK